MLQSSRHSGRQSSDELFIFPPPAARQLSNNSDPPSPRSGILKTRPSPNGNKVNGITGGKMVMDTGNDNSPELTYAMKHVRHSIVSVDSTFDLSGLNLQLPVRKRCQRRLSVYLHTHVVLIIVCSLAILDAVCVIGQLISDILIMTEKLTFLEQIDDELTVVLLERLPELNSTIHDKWNLHAILQVLLGRDIHSEDDLHPTETVEDLSQATQRSRSIDCQTLTAARLHRVRRALPVKVPGHEVDHGSLYDLTHACHLGSLAILSLLLLETFLKVFAMGKKLSHHKLEIFDALVVTISWCLDVALWEGIWAHPGSQAATYLMYLLPWRVVRIVNSFVLVIQEKEHVHLKIVKQRLRHAIRRSKEALDKAASYRHEAKAMAGMCRKLGASEQEITACSPSGKAGRRGSVQSVLERAASLTFISTLSSMGSLPSLFNVGGSSSEDEEDDDRNQQDILERKASLDPTLRSQDSGGSTDLTPEGQSGYENTAFVNDTSSSMHKHPGPAVTLADKEKTEDGADEEKTEDGADEEKTEDGADEEEAEKAPDHVDEADKSGGNGTRL